MAKYLRPAALVSLVASVILAPGLTRWPASGVRAQMRAIPVDDQQGHVALGLALRHLANTGTFMMATAHPDDENNGLLVLLNRGLGYRTALATATRGNGGQNEIGPELFEALGVLRTGELASLHRFDGAEQYFTRAVDFGYSIDVAETLEKWGRDEIIGDYVRLIRTIRPDVISAQSPTATGPGQHAHHAVAAMLSNEAYKIAGDPTKYPEQIKDGLRPWTAKKFYFATGPGAFGFAEAGAASGANQPPPPAARVCRVELGLYDVLLGRTYSEIGTQARSMHKCQGQSQLLGLPGPSSSTFQLASAAPPGPPRDERSLFEGIDTTIAGLAQFAGPRPPRDLTNGLAAITTAVQNAQKRFNAESDEAAVQPLLDGLGAVRELRARLRTPSLAAIDEGGRQELEFRLRQKEREFQQAILVANGVRLEALADDGLVVPGQPVRVSLIVANRGAADVTLKQVKIDGFEQAGTCTFTVGTAAAGAGRGGAGRGRGAAPAADLAPVSVLKKDQVASCRPTLTVPRDARLTEPYWHREGDAGRYVFEGDMPFGLPNRPTPFYAQVTFGLGPREEVIGGLPIEYRYEGNDLSGEKRSELLVVPAFSVRVSPDIAIFPVPPAPAPVASPAGPSRGAAPPPPAQGRGAAPGRGAATPPPAGRGTTPTGRGATPAGRGGTARGSAPAPAAAPAPPPPPPQAAREVRVTVMNDSKGPAESEVKLELPAGWTATPATEAVTFAREDEAQTVRFKIIAPPNAAPGQYLLKATVGAGDRRGFQVVEYPHIRRQHIYQDADVVMKVIDVKTAPNLSVGYIMGAGDEVPEAIEQLGPKVEMLRSDDLAWGDLSRFGTIVTGVRAYERREDLIAHNSRLLEFVRDGGTLIVQYNRDAFNAAQYGPYPAEVTGDRITDENAPVRILAPADPVFNVPNKITEAAWSGWVQERGIQFLGERDSRYRDLVEIADPFVNNPGAKRGGLVDVTYGKGRWVYVGLGLFRELPVGVDGAYQLLANLISLGH